MSLAESITLNNLQLARLFLAIVLLLASAHVCGQVAHLWKLPRVIGEIFGGFLLGPTVLGAVFPRTHLWLFAAFPEQGKLLSVVYWFGLVLLMFVSGFEMQKSFIRADRKLIMAILLGATGIPLIAGWAAPAFYDFTPYLGTKNNMLALRIVLAIAVAVTSIPVISKIFIDMGIAQTRFAKIVLTTATLQDIVLWCALAVATAVVGAHGVSLSRIVWTVLITLVFFGLTLVIAPRILKFSSRLRYNLLLKSSAAGYVLLICFLFAAIASILDVSVVFGAFLAGVTIGMLPDDMFAQEKSHIKEFGLAFFVPLYFAIVGLKLDLIAHCDPMFFLGFLAFSTLFETAGVLLGARLIKIDWPSSMNLAVAMNTRGGPGIVLASVAFDLGIINETLFVTLVLVALITSLLAGCWFRYVISHGRPLLVA